MKLFFSVEDCSCAILESQLPSPAFDQFLSDASCFPDNRRQKRADFFLNERTVLSGEVE
jgi:hypothetical protein